MNIVIKIINCKKIGKTDKAFLKELLTIFPSMENLILIRTSFNIWKRHKIIKTQKGANLFIELKDSPEGPVLEKTYLELLALSRLFKPENRRTRSPRVALNSSERTYLKMEFSYLSPDQWLELGWLEQCEFLADICEEMSSLEEILEDFFVIYSEDLKKLNKKIIDEKTAEPKI